MATSMSIFFYYFVLRPVEPYATMIDDNIHFSLEVLRRRSYFCRCFMGQQDVGIKQEIPTSSR